MDSLVSFLALNGVGDGGIAVDIQAKVVAAWGVMTRHVAVGRALPGGLAALSRCLIDLSSPEQSRILFRLDPPLDGYMAWVSPCVDSTHQYRRLVVVMNNRQLLELTRERDAIIDSSSDGLFVCDGGGRILRVNPASARINNASAEQLEGRDYLDVADQGLVLLPSAALECIRAKAQVSLLQESRSGRTLISTATPVFDDREELIRVVVSERDITEMERLKRDLEDQQAMGDQFRRRISELQRRQWDGREIIAESPAMKATLRQADRLSQVDSTVLLLGESGVGKGLIAELIHAHSHRAEQPMISINCGAIPDSLIEAELFGYDKGAFTGAVGNKPGQLELAHKGTVFLDEIAELPPASQVKLLRFLEGGKLTRLGSTRERQVDVRMIAATNRDLKHQVEAGLFREDLYYRLSVIPVQIPALRGRRECLVPLLTSYLTYFAERDGVRKQLTPAALDLLCAYSWPGNVRELMNLCERLVVMSEGVLIDVHHLPAAVLSGATAAGEATFSWPAAMTMAQILSSVEREVLSLAYKRYNRQGVIAEKLGMSQPTVARKLHRYGIGTPISGE